MTDVTSDDGNHIWRKGRGWVPINEDAEVAKDALIRELVAALAPFSGEKLPPLKKTERDYDRNGLRCMMSLMEIATKQAALIIAKAKAAGYEP